MATENIIMKLVSKGVSRQEAHEEIRVLSHQASDVVKKDGLANDLIQRIKSTAFFKPVWEEIDGMMDPKNFIGRCPGQVVRYCGDENGEVKQALLPYKKYIEGAKTAELTV
jgi:adenylosuccinate lyase